MSENKMIIYHGSDHIIEKPRFGIGNVHNDYGLGFYCTEDPDLAKEWAVGYNRDGYSNKYLLDISDIRILDLSNTATVLNWITILLKNREFDLKNDVAKSGKEYLIDNYSLPVEDYDVIKGYRADDSYFAYADSFLNNGISVQRLSEALRLGDLGEQIVIMSSKAFDKLSFVGYEIADSSVYYPLRQNRNMNARSEFLSNRQGNFTPDALYLIDIMRGVDPDDPRIQ